MGEELPWRGGLKSQRRGQQVRVVNPAAGVGRQDRNAALRALHNKAATSAWEPSLAANITKYFCDMPK